MKLLLLSISLLPVIGCFAQERSKQAILSKPDLEYLSDLTKDVVAASRIVPGQKVASGFGGNNTGGTLIRPGGRDCYPAFWIRDYAMSLESGFITVKEQRHMLELTASTQCDQTWITDAGSMVPAGAIADHIRIDDSKPVYFPGTYDYKAQGGKKWGMFPPYCDQYFFIHMAWYCIKSEKSAAILRQKINGSLVIDRMERAFRVPPTRQEGLLVSVSDDFRGVDFGFRDVIFMTGDLCLPSILKYRASLEMAEMFVMLDEKEKAEEYRKLAVRLKDEIPARFLDGRGMLLSSTGKSGQADVWSTVLAIYFGILNGELLQKSCRFLADSYRSGRLASRGNIRHVPVGDDFSDSTVWEKSLAKKGEYQNGAYWGTPTGWVCHAINKVDINLAQKLAREYIEDLRAGDFRKGENFGAPWECYNAVSPQNAVYMTTVTCPYSVFRDN